MDNEYKEGGYFDLISHNRLKNANIEEMLEGGLLVSIESQEDHVTASLRGFIEDNTISFFRILRQLSPEQQDLIISYYILNKTQNQLAAQILNNTQTMTSFQLRKAVDALCSVMQWPDGLTEEIINKVLGNRTMEIDSTPSEPYAAFRKTGTLLTVSAAKVLCSLFKHRSFDRVAREFSVWRPELRRAVRSLVKELIDNDERDSKLLGGFLFSLIDTLPASGSGKNKKALRRVEPYRSKDPDCLGKFRIRMGEPGWTAAFPSHSSA
jgi:hypothetical protein